MSKLTLESECDDTEMKTEIYTCESLLATQRSLALAVIKRRKKIDTFYNFHKARFRRHYAFDFVVNKSDNGIIVASCAKGVCKEEEKTAENVPFDVVGSLCG